MLDYPCDVCGRVACLSFNWCGKIRIERIAQIVRTVREEAEVNGGIDLDCDIPVSMQV